MKSKALMPIFIFLSGIAVFLFLLGLKSRLFHSEKAISQSPNTTFAATLQDSQLDQEKKSTQGYSDSFKGNENHTLEQSLICPKIKSGLSNKKFLEVLDNNQVSPEKLFFIRRNIHFRTRDNKKLRLVLKKNNSEKHEDKLKLMVLREEDDQTFSKVAVPKELRLGPKIKDVLKFYQSDKVIYEDQVNIYQDGEKELIFETIQGKIVSLNISHKDSEKSFNCKLD